MEMESDLGMYCFETYPTVSKQNTTSLKREQGIQKNEEEVDLSKYCDPQKKSKSKPLLTGLTRTFSIWAMVFCYTLFGSVIFSAIEGGGSNTHQHEILATVSNVVNEQKKSFNSSADLRKRNAEARAATVETIWEITVNLNILYRDNWTKLAAQEITRFQDTLLQNLAEELAQQQLSQDGNSSGRFLHENFEWTFAKAFLYSLTVITTIGYGSIAPRTMLGKAVTMGYAIVGIPLTILYLANIGCILSRIAKGVFSHALCCCLCSNCGYCCYDEKRMAEKEKKMKKKRQQREMQQQLALQEPFYVRSSTSHSSHSPIRDSGRKESDSLSGTDSESKTSMHGWSIIAPIALCLTIMFIYMCLGTFAIYKLENWDFLDGFYFCFMSLTTVGFGNMLPGSNQFHMAKSKATIWFCSIYIMCGMALTAMCFAVICDEFEHREKRPEEETKKRNKGNSPDEPSDTDPYHFDG